MTISDVMTRIAADPEVRRLEIEIAAVVLRYRERIRELTGKQLPAAMLTSIVAAYFEGAEARDAKAAGVVSLAQRRLGSREKR
ncbi:MAG: hypothetical protein DIU78_004125 [Pseudomonadota bacterium]|nr:MAG: hypothetical protein DIU78_04960 [Pseudomonadota bacterium]